jgi:gluconate kinase
VLLDVPEAVLRERLERRARQGGHFMPPSLLESQLSTLQRPTSAAYTTSWDPHRRAAVIEGLLLGLVLGLTTE